MKKILIYILAGFILIAIVIGLYFIFVSPKKIATIIVPPAKTLSHQPSTKESIPSYQDIKHVFIIMDENQPAVNIVGDTTYAPYLNTLINRYSLATNYSAITHPSLPNYLAITSGSTDGITTDCNPPSAGCIVNVNNIASQLVAKGLSWKEYAESMPSDCYMFNDGNYATKHVPFVYYQNIVSNKAYCNSHVVPYHNLLTDLKHNSTTPNFAFITPNLCNDMHNCSIAIGDSWLAQNVPIILNSKPFTTQNSILIITWDEGYQSDNKVAAILAGSAIRAHFKSNLAYNHYSVLHTIEYIWGLKPLNSQVAKAPLMTQFIK